MSPQQSLDTRLQGWLTQLNALVAEQQAQGQEATPVTVRESLATLTATQVHDAPRPAWVGDAMIETGDYPVPVRIYDPAPEHEKSVCLFFHGGGHMAGSVSVYDPICRKIADASGQLVVSVEYRLAPECPYPLGLEDCLNASRHLWPVLERKQRRVRRQLFLIGDSGGGTYAASISALSQSDTQLEIDGQILIYPSLDYTLSQPSVHENGSGYLLEQARIQWYFDHYFRNQEDRRSASPIHMPITARLPRTLMITAGFCPLRDEGLAYLERLRAAGVPCEHRHFAGMIHAYLNLEGLVPDACAASYQAMAGFINRASLPADSAPVESAPEA